jgi:hypothetical protein
MWGSTARFIRTVPKKLVSKIRCACSTLKPSVRLQYTNPALFTSTSMRPASAMTPSTALFTEASSVTSSSTTFRNSRSRRASSANWSRALAFRPAGSRMEA